MMRVPSYASLLLLFGLQSVLHAQMVTLARNTVIDAQNSLPNTGVNVVDGPSEPTVVRVVEGGEIATQLSTASDVRGSSTLTLSGGAIGGAVNIHDAARLRLAGGAFQCDCLEFSPGEEAVIVASDAASVEIVDGRISRFLFLDSDQTAIILANDNSRIHVAGGTIDAHFKPAIVGRGMSTINISGGELFIDDSDGIQILESSRLHLSGGTIDSDDFALSVKDSGSVSISGGWITGESSVLAADSSELSISGGGLALDGGLLAINSSTVNISGGSIGGSEDIGLVARDGASVNLSGGRISGENQGLSAGGSSVITITGGMIERGLAVTDSAVAHIRGGSFAGEEDDFNDDMPAIAASSNSVVNVWGGQIVNLKGDGLAVSGAAVVDVFGFDLKLVDSWLSGFLVDGSPLNLGVRTSGDGRVVLHGVVRPGDFDDNGLVDVADIDTLTDAIRRGSTDSEFDLNNDGQVDGDDRRVWVAQIKATWFGDANLDRVFDTADLVLVFAVGEYDDAEAGNSTWGEGDWNGDGDFDSGDFVTAFRDGGFERGPRAAVLVVPEPSLAASVCFALLFTRRGNRLRRDAHGLRRYGGLI